METYVYNPKGSTSSAERFIPPSVSFAKRAAKRLQMAHYIVTGEIIKLSNAHESLAHIYRHENWFTLTQAIERKGASPSLFNASLDSSSLQARINGQVEILMSLFDLYESEAVNIVNYGYLTSSPSKIRSLHSNPENVGDLIGLPLANQRTGLNEVLFTAHTFCLRKRSSFPMPGWTQYVLIAAPLDNSALWVRFADEKNIVTEALNLFSALKVLSDGALKTAYIPSKVVAQSPELEYMLPTLGISVLGGKQATMAARLNDRLFSTLIYTSFDLNEYEKNPAIDELAPYFHLEGSLVEIPDHKDRDNEACEQLKIDFNHRLLHLIRTHRWDNGEQISESPVLIPDSIEEPDDGLFKSAVNLVPKGFPVYRIRIDLPLFDYDLYEEGRRVNIWRVIDVPVHYSLWDLHVAIQDAMGWSDYHLHQFTFQSSKSGRKKQTFSSPSDDPDELTSVNVFLASHVLSMANYPVEYLYDFGDSWKHQLTFIATVPSDGGGYPRCIEGENACPPEDCGSDEGYFRVIDLLSGKEERYDGERREVKEWLKGHVNVVWPYRPNHFNPSEVKFDDPEERWEYAYDS